MFGYITVPLFVTLATDFLFDVVRVPKPQMELEKSSIAMKRAASRVKSLVVMKRMMIHS